MNRAAEFVMLREIMCDEGNIKLNNKEQYLKKIKTKKFRMFTARVLEIVFL